MDGTEHGCSVAGPTITYRLLASDAELAAAAAVVSAIWGDPALAPASLLRAYTHFGNPTIGAYHGGELVGVSIGFLAPSRGVHLHSHITGVLPSHQHVGIGFGLKLAQRDWCLDNGIAEVTWTFDPMIARNAYFNLRKLGAVVHSLLPNFYGEMHDALNKGEATDRLETHWHVTSPRVARAASDPARGAGPYGGAIARVVPVPADYQELRAADPVSATATRSRVRDELQAAFDSGLRIVDFDPAQGYCFA